MQDADRNPTYMDWWSLTHIAWGMVAGVLFPPFVALAIMVLWEPVEILVVSPIVARFGFKFGHETLRNSLMDIVFDIVGVLAGVYMAKPLVGLLGGA